MIIDVVNFGLIFDEVAILDIKMSISSMKGYLSSLPDLSNVLLYGEGGTELSVTNHPSIQSKISTSPLNFTLEKLLSTPI